MVKAFLEEELFVEIREPGTCEVVFLGWVEVILACNSCEAVGVDEKYSP